MSFFGFSEGVFSCVRGELFKVFILWVMVEIIDCVVGYMLNLKE